MKEYKKLLVFWFLWICVWADSLAPCKEPCTKEDGEKSNCDCSSVINKRPTRDTKTGDLHHIMRLPKRSVVEGVNTGDKSKTKKEKSPKRVKKSKLHPPKRSAPDANDTLIEVPKRSINETAAVNEGPPKIEVKVLNSPDVNVTAQTLAGTRQLTLPANQNDTIESRVLNALLSNTTAQNSSLVDQKTKRADEVAVNNATDQKSDVVNAQPTAPLLSDPQTQKVVKRDISLVAGNGDYPSKTTARLNVAQDRSASLNVSLPSALNSNPVAVPGEKISINLAPSNVTEARTLNLNGAISAINLPSSNVTQERSLQLPSNATLEKTAIPEAGLAEKTLLAETNVSVNSDKKVKREIQDVTPNGELNLGSNNPQTIEKVANQIVTEPKTLDLISTLGPTFLLSSNVTQERSLQLLPNDTLEQAAIPETNISENSDKKVKRDIQDVTPKGDLNLGLNIENITPATKRVLNLAANVVENAEYPVNSNDQNVPSESLLNPALKVTEKSDVQNVSDRALPSTIVDNIEQLASSWNNNVGSRMSKRSIQNETSNIQSVPLSTEKHVTFNLTGAPEQAVQVDNRELLLNISHTPEEDVPQNLTQKRTIKRQTSEITQYRTSNNPTNVPAIINGSVNRGLILEDPESVANKTMEVLQNETTYANIGLIPLEQPAIGEVPKPIVTHRGDAENKTSKVRRYIEEEVKSSLVPSSSINNVDSNVEKSSSVTPSNTTEKKALNLPLAEGNHVELNQNVTEKKLCCDKTNEQANMGISIQTSTHNCTNCSEESSPKTNLTIIINGRVKRNVRAESVVGNVTKKKANAPRNKKRRHGKPQKHRNAHHNNTKREVSGNETDTFPKHIIELRESNFTVNNFTGPSDNTLANPGGNVTAAIDGKTIRKRSATSHEVNAKKSKPKKGGKRPKRSIVDSLPEGNELENGKLLQISVINQSNGSVDDQQSEKIEDEVILEAPSLLRRFVQPDKLDMDFHIPEPNRTQMDTPTLINIDVDNKTKEKEDHYLPKFIGSHEKEQAGTAGSYQNVLDNLKKGFMAVGCGCPIYYDRFMGQKLSGPVIQGTLVSLPKGSPDYVKEVMCSTACCQLNSMYSKVEKEIVCHGVREWERAENSLIVPHPRDLWEAEHVVMCSFLSENDGATIEYLLSWLRIIVIYIVGILLILVLICLYLTCFLRPFKELHQNKKMDLVRLVVNKKCDTRTQGDS